MTEGHAQLILDRLNEKTEIDYCMLSETEVLQIIKDAYKEQEQFLEVQNA